MRQMFDEKLDRFDELERQMADPAVATNSSRMAAAAREHGALAKLATKYRRFKQLVNEIRETNEMLSGDDQGSTRIVTLAGCGGSSIGAFRSA